MAFKVLKLKTNKNLDLLANRHALILGYKKPFAAWYWKLFPWRDSEPDYNVKTMQPSVSLFLCEDRKDQEKWLKKNYKRIFEEELQDHTDDRKQWPKKRTYLVFRRWFDVRFSNLVLDDSAGEPIEMM